MMMPVYRFRQFTSARRWARLVFIGIGDVERQVHSALLFRLIVNFLIMHQTELFHLV